jgi:hypothetical protein
LPRSSHSVGAVLSHRSAAALWGLLDDGPTATDVTTANRSRVGRPGIRLHRVRRLDPADVTIQEGIPVTTVARTIIDLTDVVPPRRVARAVHEAEYRRLFDLPSVDAAIERANGRRRLSVLRAAIDRQRPATVVRSELEHRFLELVQDAGLPMPVQNATIELDGRRAEVDAYWPRHRLVAELDGAKAHLTTGAFEADRRRDAALTVAGLRVVRFTWREICDRPHEAVAVLRSLTREAPG